ncbi:MAG: RHS repeat protein [Rhodanobacteraceae bacterium]|nr:RHS repeat protein [Rhodanobacteraceae bacterium]
MRNHFAASAGQYLYLCKSEKYGNDVNFHYCNDIKNAKYAGRGGYFTGDWFLDGNRYWFTCAPTGTPARLDFNYDRLCHATTEARLVEEYQRWFDTVFSLLACDTSFEVTGSHPGTPVTWGDNLSDGTFIAEYGYERKIRRHWRMCNQTQNASQEFPIYKEYAYSCPSGHFPQVYYPSAPTKLPWPQVCVPGTKSAVITKYAAAPTNDAKSCSAEVTPYPCVPGTGEKLLFETDFSRSGLTFTRTYRSMNEYPARAVMGDSWVHNLSERIQLPASATASVLQWNGRNEFEEFKPVAGSTTQYRPLNVRGRILEKQADETWTLNDSSGPDRIYDTAGQLLEIRDDANPAQTLRFSYAPSGRLQGVTNGLGRSLAFEYQESGYDAGGLPQSERLIRIADEQGATLVTYAYDISGRLITAGYADGSQRAYHYGEADHLCNGGTSGCNTAAFSGLLTGVTAESGVRFSDYYYDAYGRVVRSVHADGANDTTLEYLNATQTRVTRAGAGTVTHTYESGPYRRTLQLQYADGSAESRAYDAAGGWSRSTARNGLVTRTEYNASGLPARVTEAEGTAQQRSTLTTWSASQMYPVSVEQRNASDQPIARTSTAYNTRNQLTSRSIVDVTTGQVRTTTYSYCEPADVTAGTCPLTGLIRSVDGPRTDVADITTYSYYMTDAPGCTSGANQCTFRKGDLAAVTNARGHTFSVNAYDAAGRAVALTDENGVASQISYDARGRLTARRVRGVDAAGADDRVTRYEYWPSGMVKKILLPDGTFTVYDYDPALRLTSISDNAGNRLTFTLNAAGERIKEDTRDASNTLRRTLSRTYDTLGRLQVLTDAYGRNTQYTYDVSGKPDLATDALNRVTDSNHDALGRLVRSLQDSNGVAAESKFEYDPLNNLTKVTDPKGLNTHYTYNGFGEQIQLQSPDTGTTTSTYDEAGNLASRVDANGKSITYRYDALNRLKMVDYAAAVPDESFAYDVAMGDCPTGENFNIGRIGKTNDESGSTVFCYNRFGDMVRKVQRTGTKTFTLRWQYAANGRLQGMTYPDGSMVDYVHDAHGRVSEIGVTPLRGSRQVLISNAAYYPFGPVAQWTFGNGRTLTRSFNLNYQPYAVQDNAAGGLSLGYEFDAVGNLKRLRNADQADPPARIYDYDGLNRLTEAKDAANVIWQNYSYDKTGNRLSAGLTTATTTQSCPQGQGSPCTTGTQLLWSSFAYAYANGSHHLLSAGDGAQRSYDAAGNLTTVTPVAPATPRAMVARSYVYNEANRLGSASSTGQLQATYRYNSFGERVYRQTPTGTVYTLYDQAGHWLGDYDTNGSALQQAIWLGNLPVGVLARMPGGATQLHYVEADMLGTPRVVIHPQRNVTVWRWDLTGEAFGDSEPNQDPDGDGNWFVFDMRFPGQRYDAPSGLNYNYFRDYDTFTGRYVESDPIGLRGGITTYSYVAGRPLDWVDALGLYGNFSRGGGGNAAQRRQATREFTHNGQGDVDYLDSSYNSANDDLKGTIKDIGIEHEFICVRVVCFRRQNSGVCTLGDGEYEENYWTPITLAKVNSMKNCRCERIRHITSFNDPQLEGDDMLELLEKLARLRNYRNSQRSR